jgi:DNA modification methylase
MNGEKADMVFTDPPYNVDFKGQDLSNTTKDGVVIHGHKGANSKHDKIKNDSMPDDEFVEFMKAVLSNVTLFNKGAWYFSFFDLKLDLLLTPLKEMGYNWKSIIIWKKNQATLSGKDYKSRYEPIVYGCPENSFYGERYKQEDIWEFQRTLKNDLHPTMKPIPLIENALNNSSKEGMVIMDMFLGSGSTMVASHQLKRKCYGMELDPKYCQVIIDRMKKLDPSLVIKRNGVTVNKL